MMQIILSLILKSSAVWSTLTCNAVYNLISATAFPAVFTVYQKLLNYNSIEYNVS